jgi:putative flippase GtrA
MSLRKKIRYILAGGWNTAFGYTISTGFYYLFSKQVHIIVLLIAANILAISMAFLTYKLFVFRTRGNWWREYIRSYLVYGTTASIGIAMLWLMVDFAAIPFWIAQGGVIMLTVIFSYIGHSRFTFVKKTIN